MKAFLIHFQSIYDLSNYALLLQDFSFCGVVQTKIGYIDARDFLLLCSFCLTDSFTLIINGCTLKKLSLIEDFLDRVGLLAAKKQSA